MINPIFSTIGKLIHKFDGFLYGITGICYVPKNKTVCFVSGNAFIYDPKSGDDVTNFIDTFVEETQNNLQLLKYVPEFSIMLASTSRRQLFVYKYNPSGCLTSLKCRQTLDAVCYTSKAPVLIFTGDSNGQALKWEQKPSNHLIYSSEMMLKSEFAPRESSRMQGQAKNQQTSAAKSNDPDQLVIVPNSSTRNVNYVFFKLTLKVPFNLIFCFLLEIDRIHFKIVWRLTKD